MRLLHYGKHEPTTCKIEESKIHLNAFFIWALVLSYTFRSKSIDAKIWWVDEIDNLKRRIRI